MSAAPLFSVIVPLEYHRGQWERCIAAWQAQSLPASQYEVIAVVPATFSRASLQTLMANWPQVRLEYSRASHDINLLAAGAAAARGQFLIFTEAHCWPETDVLDLCVQKLTAEPELAGFSCRTTRVTHNRLSEVEADLYDADIAYALDHHHWYKVLDQCFVTRRECYQQIGGLDAELGHFAEWALSAAYFAQGMKIGYEPRTCIHHYNIGEMRELSMFTRDFSAGEMRFFSRSPEAPGKHLLEPPPEWWIQGGWSAELARAMLRIALQSILDAQARGRSLRMLGRWVTPAVFGVRASLARATTLRLSAFACLQFFRAFGSTPALAVTFKAYIAALIYETRLAYIFAANSDVATRSRSWDVFSPANAGFYPSESYDGTSFRWSEAAAIMPSDIDAGLHRVRIECLPKRPLNGKWIPLFYLNERAIPEKDVSIEGNAIDISFVMPHPGPARLAWVCRPLPRREDTRQLGLPIKSVVQRCLAHA